MRVVIIDSLDQDSLPLEHSPEWAKPEGEWEEYEYNYRLNMCDTIFILLNKGDVIGHLGIQEDTIKALYISEKHQGQKLSYLLYEHAFNYFSELYSDDAREPSATRIWEKLMEKYPKKITYDKVKDQYKYKRI